MLFYVNVMYIKFGHYDVLFAKQVRYGQKNEHLIVSKVISITTL